MLGLLTLPACSSRGATSPDQEADALAKAKAMIPEGSADYSSALADAILYKSGTITFEELQARVLERNLPPHSLGDEYLEMVPPPPPPGMEFTPLSMSDDWKGNWGEIMKTSIAGQITEEEYDRLHAAAHPDCVKKKE